jgi:hypothetical protein
MTRAGRDFRTGIGYSQRDACYVWGIGDSLTLWRWEHGRHKPGPKYRAKIDEILRQIEEPPTAELGETES